MNASACQEQAARPGRVSSARAAAPLGDAITGAVKDAVTPAPGATKAAPEHLLLSLPNIRCAGCISGVERALAAVPGVQSARVNLSRKRVSIESSGPTAEDLVAALKAAGHTAHEMNQQVLETSDPEGRALLIRLGVAGFAMMNVMLMSVAIWSGAEEATRTLFHWISAAIALPVIAYAGRPFFANALTALSARRLNMDVPISLAILLAAGMSLSETWVGGQDAWFDAALSLTFFLLVGRYLDHRTRRAARSAAADLTALESPRALRIMAAAPDGPSDTPMAADLVAGLASRVAEVVPVTELLPGDVIRLLPGNRSPADGIVLAGQSEVDRAILTGESLPQPAGPGTPLGAGEMNLTGPLAIRVLSAGADSSLRRLADLVALAEEGRTRYTPLTDRAAAIYAPAVHLIAAAGFLGWYLATGDLRLALNVAVATLIITCPCALGLAVPAVSTAAAGRLFRQGLLVKDPTALERLAEIDSVVFDKTGTLTEQTPRLCAVPDEQAAQSGDALSVALALATGSGHPLSRGLALGLGAQGIRPATLTELSEVPGHGVEGMWNGRLVRMGRAEWIDADAVDLERQPSWPIRSANAVRTQCAVDQTPPVGLDSQSEMGLAFSQRAPAATDATATWLRIGTDAPIPFLFTDRLRPGAHELVERFAEQDLDLTLLSGDAEGPVSDVAQRLGFAKWRANLLPTQKEKILSLAANRGQRVLMVGDGLNDTAAMARAYVSIAPASAPDAARTVSDIVLLGSDLAPIAAAHLTAKSARRRILENFAIAAGYNAIAVPLALAGLASPLAAALAMSSSSILVSLNAMRLR